MTMRAKVERDTSTAEDGHGHPVSPSWADHIISLPCYVWTQRRPEIVDGTKVGMKEELKGIIPAGIDITEKDRLVSVKNRRLKLIFAGPLGVESVMRMDSHLELTLTGIEGP